MRHFGPVLLAGVAVALAIPAAFIWWLLFGGDDPATYVSTIDALPVPSAWAVEHTQAVRSFDGGPHAYRWYLVDGDPRDTAPQVEEILRAAGLELYTPSAPADWCDPRPAAATPRLTCPRKELPSCSENGRGGPVTCYVIAFRWLSVDQSLLERVFVSVGPRGDSADVGVGDEHQLIAASNRSTVTVGVDHVTARTFWSSPTPLRSATP